MPDLISTLKNCDANLLPIVAKFWGVSAQNQDPQEVIEHLHAAMLDPERAERIWDGLSDEQRGALQTLLGSGRKMPLHMFARLFGEIRKLGASGIEREKPHEKPASTAEALYYRGLIAEGFDKIGTGLGPMVYVPDDLAGALPTHKTGYSELEEEEAFEVEAMPEGAGLQIVEQVENVRQADTSIVDDLTTLLAYVQLYSPALEGETLEPTHREQINHHLLTQSDERLAFLLGVGISANLIEVQEGKAFAKRAETRRWLSGKRSEQVKSLAGAWRTSEVYRELWHVPGLQPDPTGWSYDATAARQAVLNFMSDTLPKQAWWPLDSFIGTLKEEDPDFQRPGGDYESWYIRGDKGEYLRGFESWDAVEGALLEFYVVGPLHWLGLVDLADEAARLTAYGRAFLSGSAWPMPPESEDKIVLKDDGTLLASRKVLRIDRFQLARFTTWLGAGDPYSYRLDARGIQQAAEQGINTGHIGAFISRILDGAPLPAGVANLLTKWQAGPSTSVSMERLIVLRTTAPETLDAIWDAPALRRYLGARLGPMAVIVRPDQWEALRDALGESGIEVEIVE